MKRVLLSILFFVGVVSLGVGQNRYALADGNWTDAIWSDSEFGTPGDASTPTGTNDVFTMGRIITISSGVSCRDLYLQYDVSGGINFLGGQITVNGTLIGWDGGEFGFPATTNTTAITGSSRFNFTATTFTGANFNLSNNEIIANVNSNCPIVTVLFNSANSATVDTDFTGDGLRITNQFNVVNGDLSTGFNISFIEVGNSFVVQSGGDFSSNVPIRGTSGSSSRVGTVQVVGILNMNTTNSYLNANNFVLGTNSNFRTSFSGIDQTQGWWYQTIAPGSFNINSTSKVDFSANGDQNIWATSYGNLTLSSGGSAVTKTLVGGGNLIINGNFEITQNSLEFSSSNTNPIQFNGNLSNSGQWTTSQRIDFIGTNNQVVNGNNPITFGQELRINKSSGNVTLQLVDQTINSDLRIVSGTFRPLARTVTLSGNIINDGTLEATQNGAGGFIFDGTTEISGTGTNQFRNATINSAATLSLAAGTDIDLTTNFTNNGTFTHNNNLVRFTQAGTKSISGSSSTSFYDLAVEGGTVNVNGNVDLENTLTFSGSPTIDFDGSGSGVFTLKSTQTLDASIANVGTATLQGELNAERAVYTLRGDNKGYHIIGFPVDGATVGEVQNSGFAITGNFTGASITGTQGDGFASIFGYDQSAAGDFSNGYTNFPGSGGSTASEFVNGDGYFMFTYEGDAPGTITTTGTVHTGEFTKALPYTANGVVPTEDEGWHMVANPFPSATNWDLWDKTDNIELDGWLWNPAAGAFVALVDGSGDILPQGQGFFIRSLPGAGSITVNENAKVSTTTTFFRTPEPSQIFKVGLDNGSFVDYTYIGLKEGTSFDYNGKEDASRLLNNNETISTKTADGKSVKVNRIPFQTADVCGNSIFINLEQMVNDKEYTLKFKNVSNLSSKTIQLYDHYLDQTIELNTTDSLQFTVNADAASKGSTRFEILINNKSPNSVAVEVQDICPSENAVINLQQSDDFANYLVYQGEEVVASAEGTGAELSIEVLNEFLVDSTNSFEIKAFSEGCDTVNVGNASVQVFESLSINNAVEGSSICKSETQASFSVATQINASYFILNDTDTIQSFEGNGNLYEGLIDSIELVDGMNQFTIAASKDGCQSGTLTQKLEIEVQNPIIDETITFSASNSCLKTSSDISFASQDGVQYEIFKGTKLVNSVTGDGTEKLVEIPTGNLSLGQNEFTVLAKLGECAELEFTEPIIINVEENINTNLGIVTENICGDNNTTILIENAQSGKIYTLQNADGNVSSLTATEDGQLSFNLNPNQLNIGLNEFDIQIEGEFCDAVASTNKARITMYEPIDTNLDYLTTNSCNQADAVVGIQNAAQGKTYYLYKGEDLIQSVEATETADIVFEEANSNLTTGVNEFSVKIEGEGCGIETAIQTIKVELFEEINSELTLTSNSVCYGDDVVIEIANPQVTKTYRLKNTEGVITSKIAESAEALSFVLAPDQFEIGTHDVSVEIFDENCGTVEANSTSFTVYESINRELTYVSENTCDINAVEIGIQNAQTGKTYFLFKGEDLIETISATSAGSIVFNEANSVLSVGQNEFRVEIESEGCGRVNALETINLSLYEGINTSLEITSSDVCSGDDVIIEIANPQINKTYKLKNAAGVITSKIAAATEPLSFILASDQFGIGTQEVYVEISDENCGTVEANSTSFTLYEAIDTNLNYISANTCNRDEAVIGIQNAQEGKTYKLYKGENLVESLMANTAGELIFTNANDHLVEGLNTFNIEVEGEVCGLIVVEQNLTINLFESINPNLTISSPDVCVGDEVNIEISNPQVGKTYRLMASESIVATELVSNNEILIFSLSSNVFSVGYNALTIEIIDDNCGTVTANQTIEFEIFDTAEIAEVENQFVCKNESINIDLSANVAMDSYQLYVGDELISESSNSTLNLSPEETTTYRLTGVPKSGCEVNSVNFTVEVTDLATPGILVSDNVLESSVEGDSYQWYLNGEILEGEIGKVLVAQESGDYTVEVGKANCSKISDAYTFSEEVLNANKALADAVNIYPNPVVDVLKIEMDNIDEIEITIYTLSGKFMDKLKLNKDNNKSIDMSKFSEGTYLIQLKSGKGTITKRIIKK